MGASLDLLAASGRAALSEIIGRSGCVSGGATSLGGGRSGSGSLVALSVSRRVRKGAIGSSGSPMPSCRCSLAASRPASGEITGIKNAREKPHRNPNNQRFIAALPSLRGLAERVGYFGGFDVGEQLPDGHVQRSHLEHPETVPATARSAVTKAILSIP